VGVSGSGYGLGVRVGGGGEVGDGCVGV
jgi:hypothetical protein